MVKVCILASSSAGNSTFIGGRHTRLLIDAGLSRKETFARLHAIGEDPKDLTAILITHEHDDHVNGLSVIGRTLKIPIFLTQRAAPAVEWTGEPPPCIETFQAGAFFSCGDASIQSFSIPHDSVDPVGYAVTLDGVKISVVTDLGYVPDNVKWHIKGSQWLLLESNHDLEMLKVGPYPWAVKQRVLSRLGHLSNDLASGYIREELPAEVETLVLGHLSETNNHPAIADLTAREALAVRAHRARLLVAEPRKQSEVFTF